MLDSVFINPPISSPLHPMLNLPLLKGYLVRRGFKSKIIDSNIEFYRDFLGQDPRLGLEECIKNPIAVLGYYSDLESKLWKKSEGFDGLHVGLRSLEMKYDRTSFISVLESLTDLGANPFIRFFRTFVKERIVDLQPSIIGIALTFQDQVIPSFVLANTIREQIPNARIVFGGQMITRCFSSIVKCQELSQFYDYLVLWDGEIGIYDIHREVINGDSVDFANVISIGNRSSDNSAKAKYVIDRAKSSPTSIDIPQADFSDIDFDSYLYPDILVPIHTTRSCYAKCAFCAIPYGSNSYKIRKVDHILDEMLNIQQEVENKTGHKARFFKFMEDTSSPAILIKLAKEIEQRNLDIKWETFARLEKAFARPSVMEQLYRGGCRKIHWGLESNDPDILVEMRKKTKQSYADEVLRLSGEAGILNFCFILVGFPGETDAVRKNMVEYVVGNQFIHTITLATFDLTRGSPMEQEFKPDNKYGLDMVPATDFQVRLPYTVNGENWKKEIVPIAHRMMVEIIKGRPDIGFMTLFPDQIRSFYCDQFGNNWAKQFVKRYGKSRVTEMMLNVEKYSQSYESSQDLSPERLPEPIRREHFRTKEDLTLIANAMKMRKNYEQRRFEQV